MPRPKAAASAGLIRPMGRVTVSYLSEPAQPARQSLLNIGHHIKVEGGFGQRAVGQFLNEGVMLSQEFGGKLSGHDFPPRKG